MNLTSTPEEIQAALDHVVQPYSVACGCMGPQRDEPLCPCMMRSVIRWKGVWIDLKPLRGEEPPADYLSQLRAGIVGQIKDRPDGDA